MTNVINIYKTYIMYKLNGYIITLLGTLILVHCSNCDNILIKTVRKIAINFVNKLKWLHTMTKLIFNHFILKIDWWMCNNNSLYKLLNLQ